VVVAPDAAAAAAAAAPLNPIGCLAGGVTNELSVDNAGGGGVTNELSVDNAGGGVAPTAAAAALENVGGVTAAAAAAAALGVKEVSAAVGADAAADPNASPPPSILSKKYKSPLFSEFPPSPTS